MLLLLFRFHGALAGGSPGARPDVIVVVAPVTTTIIATP
jgi:hypothetical protein